MSKVGQQKHFYTAATNDSLPLYWVVATSQDAAVATLTSAGIDFNPDENGPLSWCELTVAQAAKVRCNTNEGACGRCTIPLSECDLGEWFSSEW